MSRDIMHNKLEIEETFNANSNYLKEKESKIQKKISENSQITRIKKLLLEGQTLNNQKKVDNYEKKEKKKEKKRIPKENYLGSGSESGEIKVERRKHKSKHKKVTKHKKKRKKNEKRRKELKKKSKSREPKKTKRIKKMKKKKIKLQKIESKKKQIQKEEIKSESEVDYGDINEDNLLKTGKNTENLPIMTRRREWGQPTGPVVSDLGLEEGGSSSKDFGGKIREEKTTSPVEIELTLSPTQLKVQSALIDCEVPKEDAQSGNSSGSDLFASKSPSKSRKSKKDRSKREDSELANDEELYYKPVIGEILHEKYRVVSILGKGVYSLVVKVEHNGKEYALKILRNAEVIRESGKREIEILKSLNKGDLLQKCFIIEILDWFDHKGFLCIVLEMMGLNIRDMLNSKRKGKNFSLDEVRLYAWQMLKALAHLESKGILHLDIKPDNILYDETNKACKLSDFGTSLEVDEVEQGKEYVSRYYRAPEVFLGGQLGHGVDMWSMACTFYEMFSGQFLFAGKNDPHMIDLFLVTKGRLSLKYLKKCLVRLLVN